MKDRFISDFNSWLMSFGVNPLHIYALLSVILSTFLWVKYPNLKNLPGHLRYAIKLDYFGTVMILFFCVVDFVCK